LNQLRPGKGRKQQGVETGDKYQYRSGGARPPIPDFNVPRRGAQSPPLDSRCDPSRALIRSEGRMMQQSDLFTVEPRYPKAPGFKVAGPSRDAARKIMPLANTVRGRVLSFYRERYPGGATSDETARAMQLTGYTVRPRLTELHRQGLLDQTADRRPNDSGVQVTVWRASRKAMEAA
jgi:hypothetical protein